MALAEVISRSLTECLTKNEPSAYVVSGLWGCGKTYLWQEKVCKSDPAKAAITVSLFGLGSVAELQNRIFYKSLSVEAKELAEEEVAAFLKRVLPFWRPLVNAASQFLHQKVGVSIPAPPFNPLDLIRENSIICLDDIERASDSLTLLEVYGLVDYLVERKKCRCVLLLNKEQLAGDNIGLFANFKERVIKNHFHLEADFNQVYSTMKGSVNYAAFADSSEIVDSAILGPFVHSECQNLRTLKRSVDAIQQISSIKDCPKIPSSVAAFVSTITIEEADGKLQARDFYANSPLATLVFHYASKRGPEGTEDRFKLFLEKYYGGTPFQYRMVESVFSFISTGIFDAIAFKKEINQLTSADLDPIQECCRRAQQVDDFFFYGDDENRRFIEDSCKAIQEKHKGTPLEILCLYAYIKLAADRCDGKLPESFDTVVASRIEEQFSLVQAPFSDSDLIALSSLHEYTKDMLIWFRKCQKTREVTLQRIATLNAVQNASDREFMQCMERYPDCFLNLIESGTLLGAILNSDNAKFRYSAVDLVISKLRQHEDSRSKTAMDTLKSGLEKYIESLGGVSDRKRYGLLMTKIEGGK
jgi:hypothetical protein